jgi:hypothetical protein
MVRREEKSAQMRRTNPFIASECTSDPVEMIAHVLRESAGLFHVLHYDDVSRNQDAFITFDF